MMVVKEDSWVLIVVDEAHKLSVFNYGSKLYVSNRYHALETWAPKCEHLLLLTATPHRGRRDIFKNLLQLLDEDIFASDSLVTSRIRKIGETGINKFFIRLVFSQVDYKGARGLKESSDEKRLQPIYIRLFFEKAFQALGGRYTEVRKSIYRIGEIPETVARYLKEDYNIATDMRQILFCFDKQVFLDTRETVSLGRVYYINPGRKGARRNFLYAEEDLRLA
jgi:hypothetical protein